MTREALFDLVRHNGWANLRLLEFCRRLSAEQLQAAKPGTYGSIAKTLAHIVGAEGRYLTRLRGDPPAQMVRELERWYELAELLEHESALAKEFERIATEAVDPDRPIQVPRYPPTRAGIILTQLVHHGNEHRAQVTTTLGAVGIEPPDLSGWAFGETERSGGG